MMFPVYQKLLEQSFNPILRENFSTGRKVIVFSSTSHAIHNRLFSHAYKTCSYFNIVRIFDLRLQFRIKGSKF